MPECSRDTDAAWRGLVRNVRQKRLGPPGSTQDLTGRRTLMLVTTALWLIAAGIVALSFECPGAALVLVGIAVWLLS